MTLKTLQDFLLIQETETETETETLPFRKCFFWQKKRKQSRRNETWKAYTNGIWTINLSRDDPAPACINLCIQCITYKYLEVLNLSFDKKK